MACSEWKVPFLPVKPWQMNLCVGCRSERTRASAIVQGKDVRSKISTIRLVEGGGLRRVAERRPVTAAQITVHGHERGCRELFARANKKSAPPKVPSPASSLLNLEAGPRPPLRNRFRVTGCPISGHAEALPSRPTGDLRSRSSFHLKPFHFRSVGTLPRRQVLLPNHHLSGDRARPQMGVTPPRPTAATIFCAASSRSSAGITFEAGAADDRLAEVDSSPLQRHHRRAPAGRFTLLHGGDHALGDRTSHFMMPPKMLTKMSAARCRDLAVMIFEGGHVIFDGLGQRSPPTSRKLAVAAP